MPLEIKGVGDGVKGSSSLYKKGNGDKKSGNYFCGAGGLGVGREGWPSLAFILIGSLLGGERELTFKI